ncbi:hypothetical protein EKPJFOCH_1006 [Methylobacterium thuringiense]|uniref:Cyclodeaminase/cyclohydrolase domain-containing protein n=1 Tax=Methylobacterium thuringiense TaxID=1003091 RepID=A0ABQ4TIT9_9HYPH|nr:hypothetical protein EKPJFOCH_1006 [Methylobacterium thuringiense]
MAEPREVADEFAEHARALVQETLSGGPGNQAVGTVGLAALQWMYARREHIEAALRSPCLDRDGERMREAAAGLCDYRAERARMALKGGVDGAEFNRAAEATASALATEIRALAHEEKMGCLGPLRGLTPEAGR